MSSRQILYDYFCSRKEKGDIRDTILGEPELWHILSCIRRNGENRTVSPWVYCDAVLLRDCGAVIALFISDIPVSDFATALAAETNNLSMIQLLVNLGFTMNPYGLVYAVQNRNMELVKYVSENLSMEDLSIFEDYPIPPEFAGIMCSTVRNSSTNEDAPIR